MQQRLDHTSFDALSTTPTMAFLHADADDADDGDYDNDQLDGDDHDNDNLNDIQDADIY